MGSIFQKAKELGSEVVDSVKDAAEDVTDKVKDLTTKEEGFLVESFATSEDLESRLNELLEAMKEVNVQSICAMEEVNLTTLNKATFIVAVIKVS